MLLWWHINEQISFFSSTPPHIPGIGTMNSVYIVHCCRVTYGHHSRIRVTLSPAIFRPIWLSWRYCNLRRWCRCCFRSWFSFLLKKDRFFDSKTNVSNQKLIRYSVTKLAKVYISSNFNSPTLLQYSFSKRRCCSNFKGFRNNS